MAATGSGKPENIRDRPKQKERAEANFEMNTAWASFRPRKPSKPVLHKRHMTKNRYGIWIDATSIGLVCAWVAVFGYPYFFESLTHNYQEIATYSLDTAVQLRMVEAALTSPWFRVRINDYGHFYYNLTIALAYPYGLLFPLTERSIVFILRLVSLLGGWATIAVTYIFAKRYLGRMAAIFAAVAMGFSPIFVLYCLDIKPETWQLFFLVLSLYFLARAFEPVSQSPRLRADFRFVLAAAAAAGAAMGCKYQGIFLLPFLAFAGWKILPETVPQRFFAAAERIFIALGLPLGLGLALLGLAHHEDYLSFLLLPPDVWSEPRLLLGIRFFRIACLIVSPICIVLPLAYVLGWNIAWLRDKFFKKAALLIAIFSTFTGTFFISSPWLFWHLQFLREIYLRSRLAAQGEWFGFRWLSLLFGFYQPDLNYVAYTTGALGVAGIVWLLIAAARGDHRGARLPMLLVLGFALLFAAVLINGVNFMMAHYVLPLVPPLILLAAFGLVETKSIFSRFLSPSRSAAAAAGLSAVLIAVQIAQGATVLLKYPSLFVALSPDNQKIGEWLERCVPRDARILGAPYSYVPPKFANFVLNQGALEIAAVDPDIVTTNAALLADAAEEDRKLAGKPGYVPSDMKNYSDILFHSAAWQSGPRYGRFQPHWKSGFALSEACRPAAGQ